MANNYRCFTISANPDEDVVKKIYQILKNEGYHNSKFELYFVGFTGKPGAEFLLNSNPMKMPPNGSFVTPYEGNNEFRIKSLVLTKGATNLDIYCIY